jgi:hypothetical protein
VLDRSVEALASCEAIRLIVVALPEADAANPPSYLMRADGRVRVVEAARGGRTRWPTRSPRFRSTESSSSTMRRARLSTARRSTHDRGSVGRRPSRPSRRVTR